MAVIEAIRMAVGEARAGRWCGIETGIRMVIKVVICSGDKMPGGNVRTHGRHFRDEGPMIEEHAPPLGDRGIATASPPTPVPRQTNKYHQACFAVEAEIALQFWRTRERKVSPSPAAPLNKTIRKTWPRANLITMQREPP